jgi:glycosyltransferase involved in cell wall biosynthesis
MASGGSIDQVRILFTLAGLHRVDRGAEVAFIAVASELAKAGHEVTLIGSGPQRPGKPYRYIQAPALDRKRFESFPKFPTLRNETAWEDASFAPGLLAKFRPADYDITATCAFPFTHWALRRPVMGGKSPRHVFITQNGDWPAYSDKAEFRFFDCDGLVCTNPDYFDRNRDRFKSALIPNGADLAAFAPGPAERARFGLPEKGPVVLMVSALIPSKNVAEGIAAVAKTREATLVVAGDGPLRNEMSKLAGELLPGRYRQLTAPAADMPALYRSADAFMHLSTDESFGNVFVEAMATGLPVVAYDTARTRWIIGDGGFFPETQSPEALAEAISTALAGSSSAARKNRERAQAFNWPSIADQYSDFFEELLADFELTRAPRRGMIEPDVRLGQEGARRA